MRANAARHPDAHLRTLISHEEVLASKPIASPLKLLDCCPISDGAIALVVSKHKGRGPGIVVRGAGQAHLHQHLSAMESVLECGARQSSTRALKEAGLALSDIDYLGIYDSFTITLVILLEEMGFAARGHAADRVRNGDLRLDGCLPLNTHGGLLSFGHCGVAGGMSHAVEAVRQLSATAGARQVKHATHALVHADGGVMSSHVSLILSREG
jgi:acetyl-CoA C-acetyltransferase